MRSNGWQMASPTFQGTNSEIPHRLAGPNGTKTVPEVHLRLDYDGSVLGVSSGRGDMARGMPGINQRMVTNRQGRDQTRNP